MQRKARVKDTFVEASPLPSLSRHEPCRHLHAYADKRIRVFREHHRDFFRWPSRHHRWTTAPGEFWSLRKTISLSLSFSLEDLADNGSCKRTWAASDKLFRAAPFQKLVTVYQSRLPFRVPLFLAIEPDFCPRVESFPADSSHENACETNKESVKKLRSFFLTTCYIYWTYFVIIGQQSRKKDCTNLL